MSWIRVGDTFNGAPEFMKAFELAVEREDARLVSELKGWTIALYTFSAQQWTDYQIGYGALADLVGLTRAQQALQDLIQIGVLRDVSTDSERIYALVERDSFVHIIKSTDKKMAAKRKRDQNKGTLQVPVLLRDGDQCRYCGIEVNWADRKNDEGGTFDHRDPEEETTPDNYVVACRGCNQLRAELGDEAEAELPLLDAPEDPVWGKHTMDKLSKWRRITVRVCRQLRLPNPLGDSGQVEAQPDPAQTSGPTAVSVPTDNPPAPGGNQPSREPQFPARDNDDHAGRAVNENPRDPATSEGTTTSNPFHPATPEPTGRQPEGVPQDDSMTPAAPDVRPANESDSPVRKRRRARRRHSR